MSASRKLSTGSSCIDKSLEGGITSETITAIYGEPETGKTTLAIQIAANCAIQTNLKTLFVDCDNTFAPERLSQITKEKFDLAAEQIMLIKPKDFAEQTAIIDALPDYLTKGFGLVVMDTLNSLYRAKMSGTSSKISFSINRELNRQLAILAQMAKTHNIPIILTSQVSAVFNDAYVSVAPVAKRLLQFWADNIIELRLTENPTIIKAVLQKNRNAQEAICYLKIAQTGIHDY
jgi:DNA repair and recombination protein RadB